LAGEDLAEIEAVKITLGVQVGNDGACQLLRGQVIPIDDLTFVTEDAFLYDRRFCL
jgi:hypothetical protein